MQAALLADWLLTIITIRPVPQAAALLSSSFLEVVMVVGLVYARLASRGCLSEADLFVGQMRYLLSLRELSIKSEYRLGTPLLEHGHIIHIVNLRGRAAHPTRYNLLCM
jgi:hypothetical protein